MKTKLIKIIEIPSYAEITANIKDDKSIEIYNDRIRVMGTNEYVEWKFGDCKGIMLSQNIRGGIESIKFIMEKGTPRQCCGNRIDFYCSDKLDYESFQSFAKSVFSDIDNAFNEYKKI